MQLVDPEGRIWIQAVEARGLEGMQGLRGRDGLPPATGILLRTKEVHTLGMRFAIDTIYLSGKGTVLKVATMPPGKIGPIVLRARWVLELGAGEAARLGISPGTTLLPRRT